MTRGVGGGEGGRNVKCKKKKYSIDVKKIYFAYSRRIPHIIDFIILHKKYILAASILIQAAIDLRLSGFRKSTLFLVALFLSKFTHWHKKQYSMISSDRGCTKRQPHHGSKNKGEKEKKRRAEDVRMSITDKED